MTSSLIVVPSGREEHFQTEGCVLDTTEHKTLEALRTAAISRLNLTTQISQTAFFRDIHGTPLTTFSEVCARDIVTIETGKATAKMADIPGPAGSLLLGNIFDILPDPLNQIRALFRKFGPVMKLTNFGNTTVWLSDPTDIEAAAQETGSYWKRLSGPLLEIKAIAGQGLFTTNSDDPDWILAHKLLIPAFSPKAIRAYSHEMGTLANKANAIFQQFADSGEQVLINRWMTNFTFETIGLTGFGYNFGLLDSKDAPIHPFISAMGFCLQESITRSRSFKIYKTLPFAANYRYDREIKCMHTIVEDVIKARKQQIANDEQVPKDFLTYMLNERTSDGMGMHETLIRDQVMTFLIAGHETTSNTLSWALFELDRNPQVLEACLQEIANVGVSDEVITDKQVSELQYIERVVKETLRYHSPVRQIAKQSRRDNIIQGKYSISPETTTIIAIDATHHNPDVFENPEVFDPDRWLPENESKRSLYSWMPFSTGARGCIGRQFAMQEAKIGLAVFLRKFNFTSIDPKSVSYDPSMATTTPVNMWMRVTPQTRLPQPKTSTVVTKTTTAEATLEYPDLKPTAIQFPPMTILYGSITGTSLDFASAIASTAKRLGCENIVLSSLDDYLPKLLTRVRDNVELTNAEDSISSVKHLLVVVTSTYNGKPPDNAAEFDKWLSNAVTGEIQPLAGVHYCVFGCGNKQWRTYQMFPTKVNVGLEKLGGLQFVSAGVGDANEDIDGDFAEFTRSLYDTLFTKFGQREKTALESQQTSVTNGFTITTISPSKPEWHEARKYESSLSSTILVNRELQNSAISKRSTRHIEISVDSDYQPGDHLEVSVQNDKAIVEAVAHGFGLTLDATFTPTEIDSSALASTRSIAASLIVGVPVSLRNLMTFRADLSGPPTRLLISLFADKLQTIDSAVSEALKFIVASNSKKEYDTFVKKNRTLLDLMKAYPAVNDLSLAEFLGSVSTIVPRRYSIASSPLVLKNRVQLVVGVVEDVDPVSGNIYFGQTSGFFKRMADVENGKVSAIVRSCKDSFRSPVDINTPLIMGFLQDRKEKGFVPPIAETHLFFGCRNEHDFIYRSELQDLEESGVLTKIHVAFSRSQIQPKTYVQHLLADNGVLLWNLLNEREGKVYVCGAAGTMAKEVRKALEKIAVHIGGISEDKATEWLETRHVED
ncbi:hypothetical protein HK100_011487, partial [Physocladia obscura]